MVIAALDALVGGHPDDEAVAHAVTTVPAAELAEGLRLLARVHGVAALPILRGCLRGRPEWAIAAAAALATLEAPEAAVALAEAERRAAPKMVRTALRRALYRLRQVGVAPPAAAPPRPGRARPVPTRAWASAIDGTGTRGLWLVVETPLGGRTLVATVLSDTVGVLDGHVGPIARKQLDERLEALQAESPLPWVEIPATWGAALLAAGARIHQARGTAPPGDLERWLDAPGEPDPTAAWPPVYRRLPPEPIAADVTLLERSAECLAVPELAGWFLDPSALQSDALELLQARETRLVVSDQIKAERVAALVDRVIDGQFDPEARRRWQGRLEETAYLLVETGRPAEARLALAAALALADHARTARHIPFVRALTEKSLEIAGEVALGRLRGDEVSRTPRPPERPGPRGAS
jgi:hypothetical protein